MTQPKEQSATQGVNADNRRSSSGADDAHSNAGGAKGGPDDPRTVPGNLDQSPTVMSPKDLRPAGAGPVEDKPTPPREELKRGGAPGGALGES